MKHERCISVTKNNKICKKLKFQNYPRCKNHHEMYISNELNLSNLIPSPFGVDDLIIEEQDENFDSQNETYASQQINNSVCRGGDENFDPLQKIIDISHALQQKEIDYKNVIFKFKIITFVFFFMLFVISTFLKSQIVKNF